MINSRYVGILVGITVLFLISKSNTQSDNFESDACDKKESSDAEISAAFGDSAQEACKRISTRAEEIRATGDAVSNGIAALNPISIPNIIKAFTGGDNIVDETVKNIVNNNFSTCEMTKISNSCDQGAALSQSNVLDNTDCPESVLLALANRGIMPEYKNISQENMMEIQQKCIMNTSIEMLLQKKDSVDAQALAEIMQQAQGTMSGNNEYKSENCNVKNTNISSKKYVEDRGECAANLTMPQSNTISVCGNVSGILQDNNFKSLQSCLKGAEVEIEDTIETKAAFKKKTKSKQESTGITPAVSSASSAAVLCSFCGISIVLGGLAALESQS